MGRNGGTQQPVLMNTIGTGMKPGQQKELLGRIRKARHAAETECTMYEALATKHKTNRSRSDRLEVFAGRGLISQQATRHDLIACTPMDYSTGFDLATEHHQAAVRRTIRQLLPLFLIAELHCTPWILMQDNTNYKDRPEELAERRALERPVVEEAMQWCRMQRQAGRYYLIENPQTSRLWDEESVQSMLQDTGGQTVTCQSGAYGAMNSKGNPIRKTFRFASNNKDILTFLQDKLSAEELKLRVPLEGKETTLSQEYPQRLITSILKGVRYVVRQRNPTRFNTSRRFIQPVLDQKPWQDVIAQARTLCVLNKQHHS